MAANTSPIFELAVTDGCKTIVNADSTDKVTIQTAGADGARIDSLMISSDDTSIVNLAFYITISAVDYYIGNVNVPVGAGYTSVARVEGMTTLSPVLGYLALAPAAILKANAVTAVTAAKVVTIVAMGGDY